MAPSLVRKVMIVGSGRTIKDAIPLVSAGEKRESSKTATAECHRCQVEDKIGQSCAKPCSPLLFLSVSKGEPIKGGLYEHVTAKKRAATKKKEEDGDPETADQTNGNERDGRSF